jgi:hypothetical protein
MNELKEREQGADEEHEGRDQRSPRRVAWARARKMATLIPSKSINGVRNHVKNAGVREHIMHHGQQWNAVTDSIEEH